MIDNEYINEGKLSDIKDMVSSSIGKKIRNLDYKKTEIEEKKYGLLKIKNIYNYQKIISIKPEYFIIKYQL